MKHSVWLAALFAAVFTVVSCSEEVVVPGGNDDNPYKELELSTRSAEFIQAGKSFSFNFIDGVNATDGKDYIISPLSMQILLGMILDGARGQTADEICNVLGFGAGETAAVNELCKSLMEQLPTLDMGTTLTIANAIFVDKPCPLLDTYKADVKTYYDATVSNLDFSDEKGTLDKINGWCSEHTAGMIPKILDKISPEIMAYLLDAIYFKSQWSSKFEKSASADETFIREDGSRFKARMMKQDGGFQYTENDICQIVRLPYGNKAFSMTVLLPKKGYKVADVTAALKKKGVSFISGIDNCEVDLWLPKFETKYGIKLNELLSAMGMPTAFERGGADLSAMSAYALCVSFIRQDAAIRVDEEGTEAAAVSSAAIERVTSVGPGKQVTFHADHPFLYLITESGTGAVLFAGRYGGVN